MFFSVLEVFQYGGLIQLVNANIFVQNNDKEI